MQISVFADEINAESPERALGLAREWGMTHVEVRGFPQGRFPAAPDAELERFSAQVRDAGLAVSGVSPGFFKCRWDDPSIEPRLAEGLPRACEWAQRWGTDLVSGFACHQDDAPRVPPAVIDLVGRLAARARESGCRFALENEAGCWGGTGLEAADIIRQVGSDNLTLCWDPGNASRAGSACPYPGEYEQIKDLVSHVHMKGYDPATGSWCLVHEGAVDWPGQIRALAADGFAGAAVIETHLHISPDEFRAIDEGLSDRESNTRRNLEFVRSWLANT